MNLWLLISGVLMAGILVLHIFAGGRENVRPLLKSSELPLVARMTLYMAWHMVSAAIGSMAIILLAASFRPEFQSLAFGAVVLSFSFGLVSVGVTLTKRLPVSVLPQWVLFLPVAILAYMGL